MMPDESLVKTAVNKRETGDLGRTPLHLAARYWHYRLVERLLELGADINEADWVQDTALHHVIK
jgi:ankyrin repeat protein